MSLGARVVHRQPFVNLIVHQRARAAVPALPDGCAAAARRSRSCRSRANLTIVVGILSYDGTLHFGLWADRDAGDDLEVLAAGIEDAFAELYEGRRRNEATDDRRCGNATRGSSPTSVRDR